MSQPNANEVFREHHRSLYQYLVKLTGDADAAGDVAAETFRRLIEARAEIAHPRAWLFRVATNLVREEARSRARRRRLLRSGPQLAPLADPGPRPDEAVEARERAEATRRALAGLNPKERAVLLLYHQGFKHREIAEIVGTTTASVGTVIARALRKCAAALAPEAEGLA